MKNKLKQIFENKKIGDKKSVFIIAEMAWSHDGSVDKAKKIIKGAADAKADAVSMHITNMEDYMVKDYGYSVGQMVSREKKKKMYDYLNDLNLEDEDWKELFSYAKKLGLEICAMSNDRKSFELCKKLNPDIYVIPPASFLDEDFIIEVARQKKPVILRTGGALLSEIKNAVKLVKGQGNKKIILLHGIQAYPTKIEDSNLNLISFLKKTFKLPVGLADHTDAESEMVFVVPLMAIPLGVYAIEKHLTHNRELKGVDYIAALNPGEFKKFVKNIREAGKTLGASYFQPFSKAEIEYREVVRKKTVAARDIKKNEKITKDNITFKRSDMGVYPNEVKSLIGKTAKADIKKDEPILRNKLK